MGALCSTPQDGDLPGRKPPVPPSKSTPVPANTQSVSPKREANGLVYYGTLSKREDDIEDMLIARGFRHRIVTIRGGILEYKKDMFGKPLGRISMPGAVLKYEKIHRQILLQSVEVGNKERQIFVFQCETDAEAAAWVTAMSMSINSNQPRHEIEDCAPGDAVGWQQLRPSWLSHGHRSRMWSTATFQGEAQAFSSAKDGQDVVNMADQQELTYWEPKTANDEWFVVDFGRPQRVSAVKIVGASDHAPSKVEIASSDLPAYTWTKWCVAAAFSLPADEGWSAPKEFSPRVARFWRVRIQRSHQGTPARVSNMAFFCSAMREQAADSEPPSFQSSSLLLSQRSNSSSPKFKPSRAGSEFSAIQEGEMLLAPELKQRMHQAFQQPSEPTTPRSFFTSVSQMSRIPPPPRRVHAPQPALQGVSGKLLEDARRLLVPQVEAVVERGSQQSGMNEVEMLVICADDSATKLFDRLMPQSFWEQSRGLWELPLNKQLMAQATAGLLPDADALIVVGIWGLLPPACFRQLVTFVTVFTARYPHRNCVVLAMHSAGTLPNFVSQELFRDSKITQITQQKHKDNTLSPEAHAMATGIGWSPVAPAEEEEEGLGPPGVNTQTIQVLPNPNANPNPNPNRCFVTPPRKTKWKQKAADQC
eukprot:TRINITY_DN14000_c0_g1_i4.p1 TRINITY_DN14000_c0_g1~~TRINITY_DN14000_c0_g1_i4.p1  ORF type:complete len:647 (-),score=144.98 TRINITY_DN14000_c0_g1_i4:4-1944(-)